MHPSPKETILHQTNNSLYKNILGMLGEAKILLNSKIQSIIVLSYLVEYYRIFCTFVDYLAFDCSVILCCLVQNNDFVFLHVDFPL